MLTLIRLPNAFLLPSPNEDVLKRCDDRWNGFLCSVNFVPVQFKSAIDTLLFLNLFLRFIIFLLILLYNKI